MKVGIYLPETNPQAGGASSLLNTIYEEIKNSSQKKIEYIFLYDGKMEEPYTIKIDDFVYVNLSHFLKLNLKERLKRKAKYLLRRTYKSPLNPFDAVAEKEHIDIFWFPKPVTLETKYPYIYTVWDLGHRTVPFFPEVSNSGWVWDDREFTYQKMLYKASFVITGNEEGRKEILKNYPIPSEKIRIVPFPVASFRKGQEEKPNFELNKDYFFYPAQFWPHKNHIVILKALEVLKEQHEITPTVYFTGSDKGNKTYIQEEIKKCGLNKQVFFTGFLSDKELKYLYTHAKAMIFASLMGPNNMPPIEATYLGCPVIITDLEGHKEQLEDTALYFNGCNPKELAEKMLQILKDNNKRAEIIKSQERLKTNFENINYFENINAILEEFSKYRQTWGESYSSI